MTQALRSDTRFELLDYGSSDRIPPLMEMMRQLSSAVEPTEVQRIFGRGIRRINPLDGYLSLSRRGLRPGEYKITRLALGPDGVQRDFGDPWSAFSTLPTHSGGLLGTLIADDEPKVLHRLSIDDDPVLGDRLRPYGSLMAMPLFDGGAALNWAIMLRHAPEAFSVGELEESILRSNLIGGTVRTVVLAKQLREAHRTIREEVERIAAIQQALLPARMPTIRGAAVAARSESFDAAGGDLYLFRPLARTGEDPAEAPWSFVVADASGHGPSAAVVSAMVHAIVHAVDPGDDDPAVLLTRANRQLSANRIESSFVTAFAAVFDPRSRRLRFSRAGHEPPLLKQSGSGAPTRRLEAAGDLPLGVLDSTVYETDEIEIPRDHTLVIYTDGITEARDPDGRFFGTEGIERALVECSGEPACVINSIDAAVRSHEAGRRPADDQTIVALKVH